MLVGTFYKKKVLVGAGHCENPVDTFSERDVLSVEIWEISGPQSGETRSEAGNVTESVTEFRNRILVRI